jgi:pyridoxal phosphate enzyme (YggS family)
MARQDTSIASSLAEIRERMAQAVARVGRAPGDVTLVAVSKTFPPEAIRSAYELGLRHFGENRVQEWESKRSALADLDATFHLVGHLQSNKARRATEIFDRVDSLDSVALAQKLDAAAASQEKRLDVLVEVHLGGEDTKSGVEESELLALTENVGQLQNLQLLGFMTIPPYCENSEDVRPYFRKLRELRDRLREQLGIPLDVLSMGMSHDFEIAIEEGATEIRIGTALFGERNTDT